MKNVVNDKSQVLMESLFKQGEDSFSEGKYEEAKQCFLSVLQTDYCNAETLNNLGVIFYKEGNNKTASELFLRALSLDPYYQDAALNLATILMTKNGTESLSELGKDMFGTGSLERAKDCFLSVLRMDSSNVEALNNLGVIFYQEGNSNRATEYLLRALSIDLYYRDAALNLAKVLRTVNQLAAMKQLVNKLVQHNPRDKEMRDILDEICLMSHINAHNPSSPSIGTLASTDWNQWKADSIYLEISGVCNAKCIYCAQARLRQSECYGSMVSPLMFERILNRLFEINVIDNSKIKSISLYIWGEPFLNPHIDDILQILRKYKLYARISSNFIRSPNIDNDNLPIISSLAFSLSGLSEDSYGRIHGAPLNKTLENFERLYEKLRKYSPDTYIYIAWHRYLFNENEFWKAHNYFNRPGIEFIPSIAHLTDVHVMMDYLRGKLPEDRIKQLLQDLFLDHINGGLAYIQKEQRCHICPAWDRLAIDETGQLLLCCGTTRYDSDHVIGNILEMSAEEIWKRKAADPLCNECISSGVAHWYHDARFQNPPFPVRQE